MSRTTDTKTNRARGVDRKLMSDFVRKRIEALSIPSCALSSSSSNDAACDSCISGKGKNGAVRGMNDDTDGSCDEVESGCYPIHKGCPICIACFAGFNPQLSQEQVRFSPPTWYIIQVFVTCLDVDRSTLYYGCAEYEPSLLFYICNPYLRNNIYHMYLAIKFHDNYAVIPEYIFCYELGFKLRIQSSILL